VQEEKIEKYAHAIRSDRGKDLMSSKIPADQKLVGSGMVAAQLLTHITGENVILQPLTYLLRTGSPDGQDLLGAANFAFIASHLLERGQFGRMAAFIQNKMWTDVDLNLATQGVKTVDVDAWYDEKEYRAKLSIIWSAMEH
jgi:6-phosphofructokinase 1